MSSFELLPSRVHVTGLLGRCSQGTVKSDGRDGICPLQAWKER